MSAQWQPDSLFILDRSQLWFSVYNGGTTGVDVYRTSDGGQDWLSATAGSHDAGGFGTVDFVDAADGFVYDANEGGNVSALLATHDGGATWQPVADTRSGGVPRGGPCTSSRTASAGSLHMTVR